jgi:hypothetical protein
MPIAGKTRAREWETVWQAVNTAVQVMGADPDSLGLYSLSTLIRDALERIFTQIDQKQPFVLYNLGFNPELIFALDRAGGICMPALGTMCSLIGDQADTEALIDAAEAVGYSSECCSADKIGMGALVKGLYPEPCCLVGINTPCDSQVSVCNGMFELHRDKPNFVIDVPSYTGDRTYRHVAAQLRELIAFLETHTGQKLNWDRLKSVIEVTNRTTEYLWEWMEWRTRPPTMQPSCLAAFTMPLMIMFQGSDLGERIASDLARDAKNKVQRGVRYFDERVRAVWYQDPVWFDWQIYNWMERELGLTVPVDVFGYYANQGLIDTSSEETILLGLAKKVIDGHPMSRQFRLNIDRYIGDFMMLHQRFKADCGIFAGHVACKHSWAGIGLFKEACKKAGIPLLVFEFDMFDSRVTTYKEIQFELKRFVDDVVIPRKERMGPER